MDEEGCINTKFPFRRVIRTKPSFNQRGLIHGPPFNFSVPPCKSDYTWLSGSKQTSLRPPLKTLEGEGKKEIWHPPPPPPLLPIATPPPHPAIFLLPSLDFRSLQQNPASHRREAHPTCSTYKRSMKEGIGGERRRRGARNGAGWEKGRGRHMRSEGAGELPPIKLPPPLPSPS